MRIATAPGRRLELHASPDLISWEAILSITPGADTVTLVREPVSALSTFSLVYVGSVTAAWEANGNPAGTLYRAAVSPAPDPLNPGAEPVILLDYYGLSVSSSGLAADTTYYFRVAGVNGDGVETAYTEARGTATLAAYPPLFSGFSDLMTDSIRVLWSANGNADPSPAGWSGKWFAAAP